MEAPLIESEESLTLTNIIRKVLYIENHMIFEDKDEIKSSLFFRKLSDPQHKIKR